ncbi:hypothetical protein IOC61_03260 [Halomonas sp. KAO]|uniref:hypothetical protein n=1 Tax=Halomonas sp. KAO TaxID=2783858 RepID=UPI00189EBFEA|nr:hypothetical protein [Halomonas sp. KAO]MBF7052334.1 hypothetical protein [Halomonas sp. KAO]
MLNSLLQAYSNHPDPSDPAQRVSFGTSGHRGTSLNGSFNEAHIAAIVQSVVDYRLLAGIEGPLLLGRDTHALSRSAWETTLEVLAGSTDGLIITPPHNPPEDGGIKYNPPHGGRDHRLARRACQPLPGGPRG